LCEKIRRTGGSNEQSDENETSGKSPEHENHLKGFDLAPPTEMHDDLQMGGNHTVPKSMTGRN
jgi:hypothetical protein